MNSFEDTTQDPTFTSNDDAADEEDEDGDDEEEEEEEEDDATAPRNYNNSDDKHLQINAVPNLDSLAGLRDLSSDVVCWQLSSAKPGNGVEQILDDSSETYWQSDGQAQPHWMQVHFSRRVAISHVCLYLDFHLDESYTPKKVSVQAGMTHQDLWDAIPVVELTEPSGWCILRLQAPPDPLDDLGGGDDEDDSPTQDKENGDDHHLLGATAFAKSYKNVIRAHLIRISIQSMHQNGRDTHVRKLRLFGPRMNQWSSSEPMEVSPPNNSFKHPVVIERTRNFEMGNWFPSIR
jgi:anaphase-promoting complex subunit 10